MSAPSKRRIKQLYMQGTLDVERSAVALLDVLVLTVGPDAHIHVLPCNVLRPKFVSHHSVQHTMEKEGLLMSSKTIYSDRRGSNVSGFVLP
jgi:hypothetical protein